MSGEDEEFSNVGGVIFPRSEIIAIAAAAAAAAVEAVLNGRVGSEPKGSGHLSHPKWAIYDGFRTDWQDLEREYGARKKTIMVGFMGVSLRTLERWMTKYHLPHELWPPSTWPAKEPRRLPRQRAAAHGPATLAAGLPLAWGVIDVFFDGRLDGVIRAACALVGHTVRV